MNAFARLLLRSGRSGVAFGLIAFFAAALVWACAQRSYELSAVLAVQKSEHIISVSSTWRDWVLPSLDEAPPPIVFQRVAARISPDDAEKLLRPAGPKPAEPREALESALKNALQVRFDRDTSTCELRFQHPNRRLARTVGTWIVNEWLAYETELRTQAAASSASYWGKRMGHLADERERAIRSLVDFKRTMETVSPADREYLQVAQPTYAEAVIRTRADVEAAAMSARQAEVKSTQPFLTLVSGPTLREIR